VTLTDRVKNILLTPRTEWPAIDAEPAGIGDIYRAYVIPLAAIPAVAGFVGLSVVGLELAELGTVRIPFFPGLMTAILQFGLSLALVYVMGAIINGLAPTFGGTQNTIAAFKVAAYSYTPAWLAGIFSLIPSLAFLGILGLYSLYLLYLGLPALMRTPADKSIVYTAVVVLAGLVLNLVVASLVGTLVGVRPG